MFGQLLVIRKPQVHTSLHGKRGFTLVETVLALALLMTVVVIVAIGFTSTVQLSGNTLVYQVLSNKNDTSANKILSKSSPVVIPATTEKVTFVLISGSNQITAPISVYSYDLTATVSPDDPESVNRHVFIYAP